ncbi:MAG: glycosyltransferase family 1 protein [Parcubacteria group bacterium]
MLISIDASRAFLKQRTGVEEYSYQVIKNLRDKLNNDQACLPVKQVVLYLRKNQTVDSKLPENWKIKIIKWPYLWTQIGLSLEMLFHPTDVLFVPAHTVPIIHAKNTIVTIHGLEYEFCPEAYSFWAKLYMRWSIRNSCKWARTIISVSENTKKDLMRLYKVPEEKIKVVYEGYDRKFKFQSSNFKSILNDKISKPYLLFVGRLEERKNIIGIIKTFEILKEQYKIPHKLVLAGKFGYGKEKIEASVEDSNFREDIVLPGYVSDEEKWELLKNADVFLFPTFYEGFGIPILEAQSVGVPVVAGDNSSILEVVSPRAELLEFQELGSRMPRYSAILVDPHNAEQIADATYKLISDKVLRDDIIKKGYENVKRFSWEKCAGEIAEILKNDTK